MLSCASRIVFIVIMILSGIRQSAYAQLPGVGQWRTHLPWTQANGLADAGNYIYCLSNVSFFSYDKSDGTVQKYDKVSGLSDVLVTGLAYSKTYSTLIVVYDDANIDLLVNNTIVNISDVMTADIVGTRTINSIYVQDSLAFLSCSFGIVVLDIKNQLINNTYYIGPNGDQININAITSDETHLYAATDSGIFIASDTPNSNLADYQYWVQQSTGTGLVGQRATNIINYRNNIVANIQGTPPVETPLIQSSLYRYNGANGQWTMFYHDSLWQIAGLDTVNGFLAVPERNIGYNGQIPQFDTTFHIDSILTAPLIRIPIQELKDAQGTYWVADVANGLLQFTNGGFRQIPVNGPGSIAVTNTSIANGALWVATGGLDNLHNGDQNQDGIFSFINDKWNIYNQNNTSGLDTFFNVYAVLADPNSSNVYFGSTWYGLLIWNNGQVTRYDQYNSILQAQNGNPARTGVTAVALDTSNNLWMGNFLSVTSPLVERKKDGTWVPFSPPFTMGGGIVGIVIDQNGYLWCTQDLGSGGIIVYDPDSNRWQPLGTSNGLPSSNVLSMAIDQQGSIWVGTDAGIAVFYCPNTIFNSDGGCSAQQIIVSSGGFAGYLLSTDDVTAITVDAGNRKWVGTATSGVWLFSADGTQQLENFTVDNSPLLSNDIFSISIDGTTGEVFIGTSEGIISYRGDAVAADNNFTKQQVCVFPNPVRQTYNGPIAIRCLAQASQVMITDARGDLVYETTSVGGEAIWNGTDYTGRRADTGVYLVFAVNSDGSQSFITKLVFIQ